MSLIIYLTFPWPLFSWVGWDSLPQCLPLLSDVVTLHLSDNDMEMGKNFKEMIQKTDPCLILSEQLLQRADGHRQPPFPIEIFGLTSKV